MKKETASELARSAETILQAFHTIGNHIIIIQQQLNKIINILLENIQVE